jgi:2-C-methyl-D-erythritol 2,4-cyclodiphosphate synthase
VSGDLRVGFGFDIHRLEPGRPLWLGGVEIANAPHGPVAHSDGDVLIHALCDALLGALSLGDIGLHFPDNDDAFRNIRSIELLERVVGMINERTWTVNNVDCMVILEQPRIAPFRDAMRTTLARALRVDEDRVSVKATTHEGLGPIGASEGVAAYAVATISST